MAELESLIDNSIIDTQKPISHENPGDESTEFVAPVDKSPFRRIEFHLARKPFTGYTNGRGDGTFQLETLNPVTTSSKLTNANHQNVGLEKNSGKKRDVSEMENGLDPELSFGISFRKIGAGLENLGNTCFLNSVLQCLTYTEPLAAYLQSGKHQVSCRKSGFCALCAIQKHVSRALQLSGRSMAPNDFVSNLRCISRTFRNSRQEDAHEYMVNLLESMHKCCLPNGVPSESQSAYDRSLVHKIFGGRLRSQVKCMQCNYCSDKFDPFLDLSLEILRADNLYKAFANFTAKEQLDGGAKQYQCQRCKQKVKALKQLTIHKPPNVLTIHLKRFGSHISGQKIDKKIHFGPNLDLKPFVTGPYDGDLKYTLYGVLVHAGWSTHSGHYYCFVRTSSGMWHSLDDNRVYQVSEKKVFEQKAYMLFYFKDRNSFPTKKTKDVYQKENVMNATPSVPREAQMKTGPSNESLNCQTSLKKTTYVLKENIKLNGNINGTSASREAQMKTGLSNESFNGQTFLDGTERNGPSPVALKEIQTNTIPSDGSLNGHKSLDSVCTQFKGPGAPHEAQMKTSPSGGSLNASLAVVGADRNGSRPVAPEKVQTNSNLSYTSSNGQKTSVTVETMRNGLNNSAAEATQKKLPLVPESNSEPSKTEDHTKGIIGGVPSDGNCGGNGNADAATALLTSSGLPIMKVSVDKKAPGVETQQTDLSYLPKMETKAVGRKMRKKVKNSLKCKIISMKFSSQALMATSLLNQKKKHKRNKRVKNLGQENLVNEGPSSSVKTEPQKTVKPPVENGFKERADKDKDKDFAVLATSDINVDSTRSHCNSKESNAMEPHCRSSSQKDLVRLLTNGSDDSTVPRWDVGTSAQTQVFEGKTRNPTIGYIGDEWDEEYDRGKRKKVKISRIEFDGRNPFQDIANERLNSALAKEFLSKRPSLMKKKNNKQFKKSRPGIEPMRI